MKARYWLALSIGAPAVLLAAWLILRRRQQGHPWNTVVAK